MIDTVSRSRIHIIREPQVVTSRRTVANKPRRSVGTKAAGRTSDASDLSVRLANANDFPWVQSWTSKLQLPTPRTTRVRSFILQENDKRVGYMAGRHSMLNLGNGVEPAMWIVGAFLIPSKRGKGLLPRFGAILSEQVFPEGKVLARVAAANSRMHEFMTAGRWHRIRSTRRYTDYSLELDVPFSVQKNSRRRL